jgi:hypothetical protein
MSWTFIKTGTVDEIVKALDDHSNSIAGQSQEEFDAAKPHIAALVKENTEGNVSVTASGHGLKNEDGSWDTKACRVDIRRIY